jgi:citrate synthase
VVASTGARAAAAVSAAVGALSGPLHGGAPGPVLDMLDQVVAAGDAEAWLSRELAAGRRIMGMGHRIYRVRDPRVVVLEQATARLAEVTGVTPRLAVARQVEAAAERLLVAKYPDRALKANVELATAVLLDAVGVPRELFSAMFAVGRVVGWVAHVAEQRATGRLIRPESRYVGAGLA